MPHWATIRLGCDLGRINCMDIGAAGVFWFGTAEGLVRWDGVTFTLFDRTNAPLRAGAAAS